MTDPAALIALVAGGDSIRVVHPLFQTEGGGSIPTSPLQLTFGKISVDIAIRLNAEWHSRLPNVDKTNVQRTKTLVCYGAECNGVYFASAIWTDPIARLLNHRNWLELRRFAIARNAPKYLASRMLSWMTKAIARERPHIERLISQDTAVHAGTIYKAAGWTPITMTQTGCNWDVPSRARQKPTPDKKATLKIRWEKVLRASSAENPKDADSTSVGRKSMDLFADTASTSDSVVAQHRGVNIRAAIDAALKEKP